VFKQPPAERVCVCVCVYVGRRCNRRDARQLIENTVVYGRGVHFVLAPLGNVYRPAVSIPSFLRVGFVFIPKKRPTRNSPRWYELRTIFGQFRSVPLLLALGQSSSGNCHRALDAIAYLFYRKIE